MCKPLLVSIAMHDLDAGWHKTHCQRHWHVSAVLPLNVCVAIFTCNCPCEALEPLSSNLSSSADVPRQIVPSVRLHTGHRLSKAELLDKAQPLLVSSSPLRAAFERAGLINFSSLATKHRKGSLLFLDGNQDQAFLPVRRVGVQRYAQRLLDASSTAAPLPESGGREFFLSRPELYRDIARAYARLLPRGFQDMLDVGSSAAQRELQLAAQAGDYGVSDLALWLADKGHVRALHVDYVTGVLLTHLEGQKRVWMYPASQQHMLYLTRSVGEKGWNLGDEGWGAQSALGAFPLLNVSRAADAGKAVVGTTSHKEQFPLFEKATPVVLDLKVGDTLLIPCGWAHVVEYLGPAMSVSTAIHPDWLDPLLKEHPTWAPQNCSTWFREPCNEDGCMWAEL